MYLKKFSYTPSSPRNSKASIYGELKSSSYKVKTSKNKPYFIEVNEFEHNVFMIKFHPKNLTHSKDRYKMRNQKTFELTRLISTCIKLAFEILSDNPDATFGFIGQWDDVDVERKSKVSQRFRIYKKAILSIIPKANNYAFKFYEVIELNAFFVVPSHIDFSIIETYLEHKFNPFKQDLRMPNPDS